MNTIEELQDFCTAKGRVYQYDAEYAHAAHKLLLLKNPVGNWRVARHPWISYYLAARKQSRDNRDYARRFALRELRAVRKEFSALGLFPLHVKRG